MSCQDQPRQTQVDEMIDVIRQKVVSGGEDYDPWDEQVNGIAWIDNEVGILVELYQIAYDRDFQLKFDHLTLVNDASKLLVDQSQYFLDYLSVFLRCGGSDVDGVREARHTDDWLVCRDFLEEMVSQEALEIEALGDSPERRILLGRCFRILTRNGMESDYWRETLSESPEWVIETLATIRQFDLNDVLQIQSESQFLHYLHKLNNSQLNPSELETLSDYLTECEDPVRINHLKNHFNISKSET